jgi:Spy/CpxP family protein refolding chaperone
MKTLSMKTHLWTAAALLFGLLLAVHSALAAQPSPTQSTQQTATYGYGPGMMGPGMMYNWTPEQRQQYWDQMRQSGYGPGMMGPGMMYNWTPEQRQQYWDQMRQYMGYGPGTTKGPPAASPPQTSGQQPAG